MIQSEITLEIRDLCVEFHTIAGTVKAVDGLSYTLHKGEKLGIVGESGSGKSVSSLAVMGLIPNPPGKIVGGEIHFGGQDLTCLSEKEMQKIRGNKISMIFQEPMTSLNPIIRCGRQIAEVLQLHGGMEKKKAMQEAIELLREVGIANPEARAYEYPHQMSGGMRQRVMIAMALACQPEVLIADEPTTALDVTIQAQILDLIRELNAKRGTSILFITHDLGVVSELCDTVIVMYTGHVVEKAPVRDIFTSPKHPYTQGLLHAIPTITKERKPLVTIEGMVPNPTERIEGCSFWPRCPRATEKCKTEVPPIQSISDERDVRCWLYAGEDQAGGIAHGRE
ncbi:MAG: ABC transporter ATP-binding protein [Lachnospiraceae bacterium]|nr:ABC transporter ATP-binding protein [Lachnospiraceae bacterium]